jgi:UPF0176 protein
MGSGSIRVSSFYSFVPMSQEKLALVREQLEFYCTEHGIRGLAVIGAEGINATVAAPDNLVPAFQSFVRELVAVPTLEFKDSTCERMPFARFKVDIRPEIITTKDCSIALEQSAGTYLSPSEWHRLIENDPDVVLVDTRNFYETQIGVFSRAIDPQITKFSEFKSFVESNPLPKDKKLLLYCTGGIRCEKAVPEVKQLGYENVFQLHGGILKYLEEYPDGFFEGECFVFDHRVAVDNKLQPSKVYKLCPHCGNPAKENIECRQCGTAAVVCSTCAKREDRISCSKNCAYHVRRIVSKLSNAA